MRLVALTLAAALLVPAPALAAEPRSGAEPMAVTLSRFVLSEDTWSRMRAATTAQLRQYMEAMFRQSGTEVPARLGKIVAEEFGSMISYQEVSDLQAGILAKHYTEEEMKGLLAFYKTPLGQKVLRKMPEVMQDANGQVLALVQQRMPALMERIKAAVTEEAAPTAPAGGPAAPAGN